MTTLPWSISMRDAHALILGFNLAFFILTYATVSLRIYVKARILRNLGPDDYVMLATLFFYTGVLTSQVIAVSHGEGLHIDQLTTADAQTALTVSFDIST